MKYSAHEKFQMEMIDHRFTESVNLGHKFNTTISRNGDLMSTMYLQISLPSVYNTNTSSEPAVEENSIIELDVFKIVIHKFIKTPAQFIRIFQFIY